LWLYYTQAKKSDTRVHAGYVRLFSDQKEIGALPLSLRERESGFTLNFLLALLRFTYIIGLSNLLDKNTKKKCIPPAGIQAMKFIK
jgi:hypothetical protein